MEAVVIVMILVIIIQVFTVLLAKINDLVNTDETVYIDYLKRDFDNPKILLKHTSEKKKNG